MFYIFLLFKFNILYFTKNITCSNEKVERQYVYLDDLVDMRDTKVPGTTNKNVVKCILDFYKVNEKAIKLYIEGDFCLLKSEFKKTSKDDNASTCYFESECLVVKSEEELKISVIEFFNYVVNVINEYNKHNVSLEKPSIASYLFSFFKRGSK